MQEVENGKTREVPNHLKDANLDRERLGHGEGYLYPHNFPGHFIPQEYWPDPIALYEPTELGYEGEMKKRLAQWRSQANPTSGKNS